MMDVFLQVRIGSTRLVKKAMLPILGKSMLYRIVERIQRAKLIDRLIILTTSLTQDDVIEEFCQKEQLLYFRGPSENVLQRFYEAANKFASSQIVRITADCPLIDPLIIDTAVKVFQENCFDYVSTDQQQDLPHGLDVEVFDMKTLRSIYRLCQDPILQEHVTLFIKKNPLLFHIHFLDFQERKPHFRLTVDTQEDYRLICQIYKKLYLDNPHFSYQHIFELLQKEPHLTKINEKVVQKCP